MRIRALVASIAIVVGTLTLGAGQSSAWRDNDTSRVIDPATLVVYLTQLLGLGETLDAFAPDDPAIIGIPDTAVGIDAAPTDTTTAGDPPGTLVVDDDMVQRPNAQYTTITAAVTAAMPGDTIRVCPGIYNETVVVNKTVTLLGSSHSGGEGRCENATLPDPDRDTATAGDPPGTLVIDDDMVQRPNAQYTTITAAVTAAMPGDTIRVCPGIYNETVVVNKTVTLLGSSHSGGEGRCENATLPD